MTAPLYPEGGRRLRRKKDETSEQADHRELAARRTSLIKQSDTIGSSGRRSPVEVKRARVDLERTTKGVERDLAKVEAKRDDGKRRGTFGEFPSTSPISEDVRRRERENELAGERRRRTLRRKKG